MGASLPDIDFGIVMTSGPGTSKLLASPFFLAAIAAAEKRSGCTSLLGSGQKIVEFLIRVSTRYTTPPRSC